MQIQVNMTKAIQLAQSVVRDERAVLLAQLDIEMLRAIEAGDTVKQQQILQEKQKLRDATQHPLILDAKTPDELKQAIPQVLQGA